VYILHAVPDGDCIGSQVALARLCLAAGLDAICVELAQGRAQKARELTL
jgi:nanoRNase/pAp phosphatase (c-di-AMP/oligoRNAs hydrolase)